MPRKEVESSKHGSPSKRVPKTQDGYSKKRPVTISPNPLKGPKTPFDYSGRDVRRSK